MKKSAHLMHVLLELLLVLKGCSALMVRFNDTCAKSCQHRANLPCTYTIFSGICPQLDRDTDKIPSPPENLQVSVAFLPHSHCYSALTVQWTAPHNDGARSVEGFRVTVIPLSTVAGFPWCMHFNMTGARWTENDIHDQLEFETDCIILMPGIKYEVMVESLPIKLYHGTECDSCKKRVRVPDAKLVDGKCEIVKEPPSRKKSNKKQTTLTTSPTTVKVIKPQAVIQQESGPGFTPIHIGAMAFAGLLLVITLLVGSVVVCRKRKRRKRKIQSDISWKLPPPDKRLVMKREKGGSTVDLDDCKGKSTPLDFDIRTYPAELLSLTADSSGIVAPESVDTQTFQLAYGVTAPDQAVRRLNSLTVSPPLVRSGVRTSGGTPFLHGYHNSLGLPTNVLEEVPEVHETMTGTGNDAYDSPSSTPLSSVFGTDDVIGHRDSGFGSQGSPHLYSNEPAYAEISDVQTEQNEGVVHL